MIPNKSTFKFQELTPITGVKPYVIRFWETEFENIAPVDSDSGQKLYARKDVEAILEIKKLLFDEKLSVLEAKTRMRAFEPGPAVVPVVRKDLGLIRDNILEALELVKEIKVRRKW